MAVAPVSVCMIVKNESGQIESCLKSIRPYVSEICVVDTGSTDNTPETVKKYADKFEVYTDCNDDEGRIEDFSKARQRSFELATSPWTMWVDGDDEVQGAENLKSLVEMYDKIRNGAACSVMFPYEYAHDHRGNVTCLHYRERLVTPKEKFNWKGPVHEVLVPKVPVPQHQSDKVRMIHKRTESKKPIEPGRNLRILKAHYEKAGESDVRQLYYLGLEYGNVGDTDNAIKFHKRYTELSGWDDEKFLACLKIAEHYQARAEYENSITWALKALTVREGWAEAYFSLAKSYYFLAQKGGGQERRHWERCIHFSKMGIGLPPTKTILFVNPLDRDYDIHRYMNLALNKVGDVEGALSSVNKALEVQPDDEALKGNKRLYEEFIAKRDIRNSLSTLVKIGVMGHKSEVLVNDIVEKGLEDVTFPKSEDIKVSASIVEDKPKYDIALYVGPGVEPWNPKTAKESGIGGSETAAIEVSKRLVKLGHKVKVYGHCGPGHEGIFDGVTYLDHTKFMGVECDLMITSRRPQVVDDGYGVKSRANLCWVHDIHLGDQLTHIRALRINKFLTLSDWHKNFFLAQYDFVHPSQVLEIRNGIDLERFNKTVHRNPHRAIYSSSPDRGMQVAIQVWPKVREQVPDAELHIYYGFQTWEACASGDQKKLIVRLKEMIEENKEHGVVFHGRIPQDQLAEEYLKSGVWAYPTWFSETSCISAMEAHAAGLYMVTSPIAALNETVGARGAMIEGDWLSPEYHKKFAEGVVRSMLEPDPSYREELQEFAKKSFSWDGLAKEWSDKIFPETINEAEANVMPPYKSVTGY